MIQERFFIIQEEYMSLQLILGGSGSGKTTTLYRWITEQAIAHPLRNFFVIVPEQFTLQTQHDLVTMNPRGGILNIDVLSFQRLAYRVFEETGTSMGEVLTETGKNLVLRRVGQKCKEELKVLAGRMDREGYISQVKSMISELDQYAVTGEQLDDMIQLSEAHPALAAKLEDIRTLRTAFADYCSDKFITGEQIMNVFAGVVPSSGLLKNSVIAFDGFTGFTPVQMNALREIFKTAARVLVTVTVDPDESLSGRVKEEELFALSKRTIGGLEELAAETHTECLEPVKLPGPSPRFREGSGLERIERSIFRYGRRRRTEGGEDVTDVTLHVGDTPVREAAFAARTIRKLVDEEGMRYREIAVITGDPDTYEEQIRRVFTQEEIPHFIDRTLPALMDPCLEFIRAALEMTEKNYSYESVVRFLRTGFCRVDKDDADKLENCVLAMGIRGRKMWQQEWNGQTRTLTEEDVRNCDSIRKEFVERLGVFPDVFAKGSASAEEYTGALYDLMVAFGIREQLEAEAEKQREAHREERAREYEQVYPKVIALLDELVGLLGSEILKRRDYIGVLDAGFSEIKVGIIPPGVDEVHVGDMERTRLAHIKALIFLGVNDGWIPSAVSQGGIVSDLERRFLLDEGIALAPGVRENSFIQRFYLYLCLTKPAEKLFLSYSRGKEDGSSLRPSYLITTIRNLLPQLEEEEEDRRQPDGRIIGADMLRSDLKKVLSESIREYLADEIELDMVKAALAEGKKDSNLSDQLDKILGHIQDTAGITSIEPKTAGELYEQDRESSVTRLEQFARCPYAHFALYGLKLKEREQYIIESRDIGTIMHRSLQLFELSLEERNLDWAALQEEEIRAMSGQCLKDSVSGYGRGVFFDNARNSYMMQRLERILVRTVTTLSRQLRAGMFRPTGFEVEFHTGKTDRPGEHPIPLQGKIDRLDTCNIDDTVYVKVIDYKSSSTDLDLNQVYHGLQLQLITYLSEALEMKRDKRTGKEAEPAAVFYYSLTDPIVKVDSVQSDEETDQELMSALRPKGLISSDDKVISAMDTTFREGSSLVIPVSRNKNGSVSKRSQTASAGQMKTLIRHTRKQAEEMSRRILEGRIETWPSRYRGKEACTYCSVKDICGFDSRLEGCRWHSIKPFSDGDTLWKTLMEEQDKEASEQTAADTNENENQKGGD